MGQGRKVIAAVAASAALGLILTASGSAWSIFVAEQPGVKWRAGFRVSLVRTPAPPRSRREEVGSLARVCARFAPNFGRGAGHQGWAFCRERQHRLKSGGLAVSDAESPPDFPARRGPEPSGWSEMDQLGPKTGRVQPRRPPLWNFATACMPVIFT